MNRTISLVDLSEKVMRIAIGLAAGMPKWSDELTTIAGDLLVAASEAGELAVSELAGLREEGSGDRKAEAPEVPVTGTEVRTDLGKLIHAANEARAYLGRLRHDGRLCGTGYDIEALLDVALTPTAGRHTFYSNTQNLVLGVPEPARLDGFPKGKVRLRLRKDSFAVAHIRPPGGGVIACLVKHGIGLDGERTWTPGPLRGTNVKLEAHEVPVTGDPEEDRVDLVRESQRLSDIYGVLLESQDHGLIEIRDEIVDVAANLLTAAIERGEAKEEDVMGDCYEAVADDLDDSSGDRKAEATEIPVPGIMDPPFPRKPFRDRFDAEALEVPGTGTEDTLPLHACPFCGTLPIIRIDHGRTTIRCEARFCLPRVEVDLDRGGVLEASVEAWNRRFTGKAEPIRIPKALPDGGYDCQMFADVEMLANAGSGGVKPEAPEVPVTGNPCTIDSAHGLMAVLPIWWSEIQRCYFEPQQCATCGFTHLRKLENQP